MTPWYDGLTERQRRFCEAYASNGGNAYQAATVAGYKKPKQQGEQNLRKLVVSTALESLRLSTTSAAIATREERQSFWTKVLRGEEPDADGMPPKMSDRLRAAELLGKSQADFIDRVKHEGGVTLGAVLIPLKEINAPAE